MCMILFLCKSYFKSPLYHCIIIVRIYMGINNTLNIEYYFIKKKDTSYLSIMILFQLIYHQIIFIRSTGKKHILYYSLLRENNFPFSENNVL